jgi:hypothetical protein
MKCENCGSINVDDISDISYKIYLCNDCSFYWIEGKQDREENKKIFQQNTNSRFEASWKYFNVIKKCLEGLYEILEITNSDKNIYFLCGLDNLTNLRDAILDLLSNGYNSKEIKIKLRDLEFKLKKNIFFDSCSKEIKIEDR